MPKSSDDQLFFINFSKSWKISSPFLELEDFIHALAIKVLEGLILVLLLDGYIQMVKSWKILSLLFELEGFTFALAIDILESFIFALL